MDQQEKAKLTIVIPVHNRAAIVEPTLQSIAEQTLRPLHVVLVDNASTDGTMAMLQDWAQKHRCDDLQIKVISEPQPGAAAARNAGLNEVTTEWTMFFDSDDLMAPSHVARALKCVQEHPKVQIVGWDVTFDNNGKKSTKPFATTDMLLRNIINGTMATQRYMAQTLLFRQVGAWCADVRYWDDMELGHRLLSNSPAPIIYKVMGKPTVTVVVHGDSITGSDFSSHIDSAIHVLDCIEQNCDENIKWMPRLRRAILAGCCLREGNRHAASKARASIDEDSRWRRTVYNMAYHYTRLGGRGAGIIFRNLL